MAKAINWPRQYRETVLAEDTDTLRAALRLGALYYEGRYWVDQERVDIRVNHLKIRKALIQGDLKLCAIEELSPSDLQALKPGMDSVAAVVNYLKETYQQPVNASSQVTVVYYKNEPINPDELEQPDDPHM